MRRRAPRPLSEGLAPLVERWAPRSALADVQRAWPEVVGPVVARAATPTAERRGVVTVTCESAVWAQELDLLGPGFAEALNEALGAPVVTRLKPTAARR
jgi:predicted nucleic acid-binding Zn ribbon protein